MIVKRTFDAAKHPVGSPERARLNLDPATSEYMTGYKYAVQVPGFSFVRRTRREAEEMHAALVPFDLSKAFWLSPRAKRMIEADRLRAARKAK